MRLGSLRWLRETGVNLEPVAAVLNDYSASGGSIIGVAIETSLRGFFVVKDTLKPRARQVIDLAGPPPSLSVRAVVVADGEILDVVGRADQVELPDERLGEEWLLRVGVGVFPEFAGDRERAASIVVANRVAVFVQLLAGDLLWWRWATVCLALMLFNSTALSARASLPG